MTSCACRGLEVPFAVSHRLPPWPASAPRMPMPMPTPAPAPVPDGATKAEQREMETGQGNRCSVPPAGEDAGAGQPVAVPAQGVALRIRQQPWQAVTRTACGRASRHDDHGQACVPSGPGAP
ncbi:hypothetical protein PMIN03_000496 [Paraphaeosphaeria minitans]